MDFFKNIDLILINNDSSKGIREWKWEHGSLSAVITEFPKGVLKKIDFLNETEISDDDKKVLENIFSNFLAQVDSEEDSGIEPDTEAEVDVLKKAPYDSKKIKITKENWSVDSVAGYMRKGIINLSPDFQRNFVWDSARQSQLIESILLGIPVPAFYLAKSGKSHQVVDGLQRLTTIKRFVNNEFPLRNLEYLNDSQASKDDDLNGCYYNKDGKRGIGEDYEFTLSSAQLYFNIIEESTPTQVKFDIFRRLNTGGKPLNNQEIRNCMMEEGVRNLVNDLVKVFLYLTDNSVSTTRMGAHELVMRFIAFWYEQIQRDEKMVYQGNMQSFLDSTVDKLNKDQGKFDAKIKEYFEQGITNAVHLFGRYAFRKCLPEHLQPGARGQLINKSLFTTWGILLSSIEKEIVLKKFPEKEKFIEVLANALEESRIGESSYYNAVSYKTNDKSTLEVAFFNTKKLINKHLLNEK